MASPFAIQDTSYDAIEFVSASTEDKLALAALKQWVLDNQKTLFIFTGE